MPRQRKRPLWTLLLILGLPVSFTLIEGRGYAQDDGESAATADETEATANDTSSDPNVVTYPENEEPNEVQGDNSIKPQPISPARKESLKRRAGEQVGSLPRGRAIVLGMYIQEADNERAKVVEVSPASPAFDAGIRKGDEIVSFDGFKTNKYREWIDGMRRLAGDAPDGDTLPIVLMRSDKRLNLRLRIPVAKAAIPSATDDVTLNQTVVPGQAVPPTTIVGGQNPYPAGGGGYGGDTLIAGALGDDFNSPDGDNANRAVAEIVLLDQPLLPRANAARVPTGSNQAQLNQRARNRAMRDADGAAGARVGIAGFRNDANGMFVMLDIGGLPAGNYVVGIDDPGLLATGGGAVDETPNRAIQNTSRARARTARTPRAENTPVPQPPPEVPLRNAPAVEQQPKSGQPQPRSGQAPANPAGASGPPQSRLETPNRNTEIPRGVLAQVAEPAATDAAVTSGATPAAPAAKTPATGQIRPPATPATGATQPVRTPATGQPGQVDPRQNPNAVNDSGVQPGVAGTGVGPTIQIGTLTVDQSGTGRLQQVVEAVSVQDVIGQAILIYGSNGNPQNTLPPNLNPTIDPATGVGAQPNSAVRSGQRTPQAGVTAGTPAAATQGDTASAPRANPGAPGIANGFGGNRPIAGGVIRQMSEGVTNAVDPNTAEQGLPSPQSPGDAQSVPQNSTVPAGAAQPVVR